MSRTVNLAAAFPDDGFIDFSRSIRAILETQARIHSIVPANVIDPQLRWHAAIDKTLANVWSASDSLESFRRATERWDQQLSQMSKSYFRLQESLEKSLWLKEPLRWTLDVDFGAQYAELAKKSIASLRGLTESPMLPAIAELATKLQEQSALQRIEVGKDGISVGEDLFSVEEVAETIEEELLGAGIVEALKDQSAATRKLSEAIDRLAAKTGKSKSTVTLVIIFVICQIFIPFVNNFLQPFAVDLSKKWLGSHEAKMAISGAKERLLTADVPVEDIGRCRLARGRLVVRTNPRRHSCIVETLPPGRIVLVRAKHKYWRQVFWWDQCSGDTKGGWVRAKYLQKIR